MLLDIGVTDGMQLRQITRLSKLAQRMSINRLWIGEDMAGAYDVFTVASIILLQSSSVNVGIGITSPLIRNISTIARASVSLAEIGGDKRFRLGLGVGGLQDLAKLGITLKNPERLMRNATTLLKSMWNGEKLSFKDSNFVLENYYNGYGLGYDIPIYFGVRGPKLLKLAGEIADGVILSGPKTYLQKAVKLVSSSIRKSPQPTRNFQFVVWIPTMLIEKPKDLNIVKRTVAFVLADTPRKVVEMAELNQDRVENIKKTFRDHGLEKALQLVTRDLIEEATIHGNSRQICDAFKSFEKLGVQEVIFGPPYGANPEAAVTKLAKTWSRFS